MNAVNRRAAIVTGGTRGIGLGISAALAAEGWDLAVCGTREESAVSSLEGLRSFGNEVLYVRADVGDPEARGRLIEETRARYGRLDLLVNNAGVAPAERRDLLDATPESYERVMRINLEGPYFLTQAAANWMIEERGADPEFRAAVIFVGSISATVASVNRGEYCLSKAGIAMAARLWAVRLGEYGIPVYEIRPGITRTDMTAGVTEKYDRLIADGLLVQPRWGTPEDVGKAAAMLARGDMPYSTGQVIMVDGGLTLDRL